MDYLVYLGIFGTGLLAGSFLNLVADRISKKETFISGRSKCQFCNHELSSLDLIPLFSFIARKGKCNYCNKKLSFFYPTSELLTGIFFTILYYFLIVNNYTSEYYLYFYFNFMLLLIIFFYDYKYYEIPFKVVVLGSTFSLIYRFLVLKNLTLENIITEILTWLGIFLFYYFIIWISKGGMGGGDLKLSVYLGIFLGFPLSIHAIYYGFLIGGVFATIILLLRKKSLKSKIPFGPFLVIGALLALLISW
jgi:prepilin signal peptidase PulO-like enzyme (type II secretory pathway)